jgi:hypothetical protein
MRVMRSESTDATPPDPGASGEVLLRFHGLGADPSTDIPTMLRASAGMATRRPREMLPQRRERPCRRRGTGYEFLSCNGDGIWLPQSHTEPIQAGCIDCITQLDVWLEVRSGSSTESRIGSVSGPLFSKEADPRRGRRSGRPYAGAPKVRFPIPTAPLSATPPQPGGQNSS